MNKLQLSFMRVLHNTLVNITNEHKGSQWAVYVPSVQYDPLQAHEIGRDESKGVMVNPL